MVRKATDCAKDEYVWAREHLPEILDCVDLPDEQGSIQDRLCNILGSDAHEKCVLRVSFHKPLEPLII